VADHEAGPPDLEALGIRRLDLFGHGQGEGSPDSDIDLAARSERSWWNGVEF
jgi:predicted nucleotidyltransferase